MIHLHPRWRWCGLLIACAILALAFVGRGETPELSHATDEDAFVSYYQAAHGLATGLQLFESMEEFERQKADIDRFVVQLAAFREEVEQLSEAERAQLAQQHTELIEQTKDACRKLREFHASNPEILGNHWEGYWSALPFTEDQSPIQR